MPWRSVSVLEEKRFFILEYQANNFSITDLALRFCISRKTAYKYIDRYKQFGDKGLENYSCAPITNAHKTPKLIEELIVKTKLINRNKRYSGSILRSIIARENPNLSLPSSTTIDNILKRNGLTKPKRRKHKAPSSHPNHLTKIPNDIWATDFKGHFRMRNGLRVYPLTIHDMGTRQLLGVHGQYSENTRETMPFFTQVFRENGLPKYILSDNGSPFGCTRALAKLTSLSVWFIKLGITPIYSVPGHPEHNPIIERMHRDLKAAACKEPSFDLKSQQRAFNLFQYEYNNYKPHSALDYKTPSELYQKSKTQFPKKIPEYEYPAHFERRRVYQKGAIRWRTSSWVQVATTLTDEYIGLEQVGEGLYCVWFCHIKLGYLVEKKLRIEDNVGRLKRNL